MSPSIAAIHVETCVPYMIAVEGADRKDRKIHERLQFASTQTAQERVGVDDPSTKSCVAKQCVRKTAQEEYGDGSKLDGTKPMQGSQHTQFRLSSTHNESCRHKQARKWAFE